MKCNLLMVRWLMGERSSSAAWCLPEELLGNVWAGAQIQRLRLSFSRMPQRTLHRGGFGSETDMSRISSRSLLRKVGWAKCRAVSEWLADGLRSESHRWIFFLIFFKSYIGLCQHHKICIFPLLVQVICNRYTKRWRCYCHPYIYPRDGATVLQLSLQTAWKHGKGKRREESLGRGNFEYSHGTGAMFFVQMDKSTNGA